MIIPMSVSLTVAAALIYFIADLPFLAGLIIGGLAIALLAQFFCLSPEEHRKVQEEVDRMLGRETMAQKEAAIIALKDQLRIAMHDQAERDASISTLTEFIERINIAHVGKEPIGDHLAMAMHYIRAKNSIRPADSSEAITN